MGATTRHTTSRRPATMDGADTLGAQTCSRHRFAMARDLDQANAARNHQQIGPLRYCGSPGVARHWLCSRQQGLRRRSAPAQHIDNEYLDAYVFFNKIKHFPCTAGAAPKLARDDAFNRLLLNPAASLKGLRRAHRCDATSPATPQTLYLRDSRLRLGYLKIVCCCDPK
jgi:hypothetical protein